MRTRPPWHIWLAAAVAAGLRALPYLAARTTTPEPGFVFPPIGYNPKDWLAYVAFIRETATTGALLVPNPFTTAPQGGRYLLLLQDLLGVVSRVTGADPFVVLELSRIPLLFLLTAVLWRLTGAVLATTRERAIACWLVLLSGGLESLVDAGFAWIPAQLQRFVQQDLWHLQGWNTFAASYNPLWVAALALTLWVIVPLLRPAGPSGVREQLGLALGFGALFLTHPYSAIVVLAVAVLRPVLGWLLETPHPLAGTGRIAVALAPVLALGALVAAWQSADAVYRATSGNVLGPQALSVFWYPVTLGAVGVFAVRGWRRWILEGHPCALGMAAWTLAVVSLHTSPVLNGYHFAFHLYVPVCLAAAPALAATLARLRERRGGVMFGLVLGVLVFQSAFTLTRKCIGEVHAQRLRADAVQVLQRLAREPAGNVLAPPDLGNYVPAYTPHRVYVGQWFLTPQYAQKSQEAVAALSAQLAPEALAALVDGQRIRYVVTASRVASVLVQQLGARVQGTTQVGDYALLVLVSG